MLIDRRRGAQRRVLRVGIVSETRRERVEQGRGQSLGHGKAPSRPPGLPAAIAYARLSHTATRAAPGPRHRPDDPRTACYPRQTPGRGDRSRSHYWTITQEID